MHKSPVGLKEIRLMLVKWLGSGAAAVLCAWSTACSPGQTAPDRKVPTTAGSPVQAGPSIAGAGGQLAATAPQAGIGSGVTAVSGTGAILTSGGTGGAAILGTADGLGVRSWALAESSACSPAPAEGERQHRLATYVRAGRPTA
jgi:hypothetical protein